MPSAPKRVCPACRNTMPCACERKADQRRGSSSSRGYDRRWQQARDAFLAEHPLCAICERAGRLTAASCVDHVIPHRRDLVLFWDQDNWQSLCFACHAVKTATEDGGFGHAPKLVGLLA